MTATAQYGYRQRAPTSCLYPYVTSPIKFHCMNNCLIRNAIICRIHHGGEPRIEGIHDRPHLGPWEPGQDSGMPHSTYLCHAHKLNRCETPDLQGLCKIR